MSIDGLPFDPMMVLLFLGMLTVVGIGGAAVNSMVSGPRRKFDQRLQTVRKRAKGHQTSGGASTASLKRKKARGLPLLESIAKRLLPRQSVLKARLDRTGRDIAIGTYVLITVVLMLSGVVATRFYGLPLVMSLAIGIIFGVGLPHFLVGKMAERRLAKFNAIFPDAIDLIVRGLKSGLPVTESMAAVGAEMADPVGNEFRRITDSVRFGQPIGEALWDTAKRLDIPEFNFFVISLSVQSETGGNLAETLANLSDILRQRRQMRLKIKAMSSEARASAMILGSLPFIMFAIIYLLNPGYEEMLFTDPRGKVLLGGGVAIMTVGIAVMRKMVRFEI